MSPSGDEGRDLAAMLVPQAGAVRATGNPFEPFEPAGPCGDVVGPVSGFLRELQGRGRPESTQRSYALALLRWFRFIWAAGVAWDQATRAEARVFMRWLQTADKPERVHWRTGRPPGEGAAPAPGTVNPVTGKASPGHGFAPATAVHCETVLRAFYEFHLEMGTGPIVNPFPLACLRCPMININPKMLPRLDEIEADLQARRSRAGHQGWLGEIEGIDLTLAVLRQRRDQTRRLARIAPTDLACQPCSPQGHHESPPAPG